MKILFVTDTIDCWKHGIWWHRIQIPSDALASRGHMIRQVAMGSEFPEPIMEWPDVVIFGRTYPQQFNPVKVMNDYKARGKRVLYDMDDDFWQVAKDNPSVSVSNVLKDQYEGQIRAADAVITPSEVLAKKFKKHFKKPIFICPNGIPFDIYTERPKDAVKNKELTIGYMGAASHWGDLRMISEAISKLSEKYTFTFKVYGLVGEPLEAAIYAYNKILSQNLMPERNEYYRAALDFYNGLKNVRMWHIPFMPPELHPKTLSMCDFDIGIAPLEDTTFNQGKSCVKYYEYASVGTPVLASDVAPYNLEMNKKALVKNTTKDWYNKLEKLLTDDVYRSNLGIEQYEWVKKNRSTEAIGLIWELACQRPGGLKVLNQS